GESIIRTVGIYLANNGGKVVHVGFHHPKHRVGAFTMLAAAFLPALPLVAKLPSWHHMFPLNACSAHGLCTHLISTAIVNYSATRLANPLPLATTVTITFVITVVVHLLAQ